jgi:hypothetical protein
VARLEETQKEWLESVGVNINRDPEHDAAGINDDWPVGRGVFIHDKKSFVVLVNFEDHLELVVLPDEKDSIKEGLSRLIKLV